MKGYTHFEPSGYYHVVNHAVGKENIFLQEDNYRYFLMKFADYMDSVCDVLAYCLMPNHIHFLLKIHDETILAQHPKYKEDVHKLVMQELSNLLNAYTKAYNKLYKRKGPLWLEYTKRFSIDSDLYFTRVIHYIHENPVNHGFVSHAEDWKYSSYKAIISDQKTRLNRQEVLDWFGGVEAYKTFHEEKKIELEDEWERA